MAQYGCQNFVACVGKWPQSNVWNHLSSGKVWKTTVLCILQKSLLIDFIYIERVQRLMVGTTAGLGGEVLIYFCFFQHPGLISALGTFEWDCAKYGFYGALFTRFIINATLMSFLIGGVITESWRFRLTVFSVAEPVSHSLDLKNEKKKISVDRVPLGPRAASAGV